MVDIPAPECSLGRILGTGQELFRPQVEGVWAIIYLRRVFERGVTKVLLFQPQQRYYLAIATRVGPATSST